MARATRSPDDDVRSVPAATHFACQIRRTPAGCDVMRAMPPKTSCPVSLSTFIEKAEPLKVTINGQDMIAEVKQFSTGSFGWYMNAKLALQIDGKMVSVQIGMNMPIVGSKDADRGDVPPAAPAATEG